MNSRKLFALFMVFALTGGALAGQQNTIHCDTTEGGNDPDGCDPLEAKDVTAIQQHSVFVEVVVEAEADQEVNQIHEFAAVVGLVKKCKRADRADNFDNAVLWFNDQFLFGDKERNNTTANVSAGIGFNPNETGENVSTDTNNDGEKDKIGFIQRSGAEARWGGCFIPDGFMHAIGVDDPYGTGFEDQFVDEDSDVEDVQENPGPIVPSIPSDNIDYVKELIQLDNDCLGCIFEYQSTFFITDPNNHRWMVDKLIYPGSLQGNLFQQGPGECPDGSGTAPVDDPRDNYPHHNRCEDPGGNETNDKQNHCTDGDDGARYETDDGECGADTGDSEGSTANTGIGPSLTLGEPIFTVHTQVNPRTLQGFADKARWAYSDGDVRKGMPYPDDEVRDDNFQTCKENTTDVSCSVEYDFLIAVDFAAFDQVPVGENGTLENEGNHTVHHGEGALNNSDSAEDGNSHDHNPESIDETTGTVDAGPRHEHSSLNLDLFFDTDAPFFVEENPYWDSLGAPPHIAEDCSTTTAPSQEATPGEATAQQNAVEDRTPIVCDVDADQGEFHRHDGSQTPTAS